MHIVIIGNGISGISAARLIRQYSNHKVSIISAESELFFSRTALMYVYMGHMRLQDTQPYDQRFWLEQKINLIRAYVYSIDFSEKTLSLKTVTDEAEPDVEMPAMHYDKLILSLGSTPNKFGWKGQDLQGVRGLYSLQDLQYIEHCSDRISNAVIVGGGLIGIELAEMLQSRNKKVTMLVREESFLDIVLPMEESSMINKHILEHDINLRLSTELQEIREDSQGRCNSIITTDGEEIGCEFVGLTAGVSPNVSFLSGSGLEIASGILVDEYLQSNIPDVYAIGDCAELKYPAEGRNPIEAVWYTARMMGETVARTICGKPAKYDAGIWFNSAKFLEIEYQVYGFVPLTESDTHNSFFWMSEDGRRSLRIVYLQPGEKVVGFNLMGMRFRHEVCTAWINDKAVLDDVISHLSLAQFDPEFSEDYHEKVMEAFNRKYKRNIKRISRRSWTNVYRFLNSRTRMKTGSR